jgi:hypothetical protein
VESPKHSTARHLSPPYPPTHVREKSTLPKHGTARPLTPPTNPPFVEWGGGQGVFTVARLPRTALQVAYPPPEKPTILGEQGGGEGGVHRGVAQAWHCTSPIPPLPPLMSGIIKN